MTTTSRIGVRADPEPTDAPVGALSTAPPPPRWETGGPAARLRGAWRQLTSMRTALVLLFLLALAAVPGTLLPQRGLNPLQVAQFYRAHPGLAPVLDRLSLFDVFAAPWFAAIYLLLFVSLVGCLVTRVRLHARALTAQPPAAPRHLDRLRVHTSWRSDRPPAQVVDAVAATLRSRRFRVQVRREASGAVSVAAEKGYLRETGNLLFHIALLALLVGVALGGLFGYKGTVLVVQGDGFANTLPAYDDFSPGRMFSATELAPFSFVLNRFAVAYLPNAQPSEYDAWVSYRPAPADPARTYDIRVNHPLDVDGSKVYLIAEGYAPQLLVRDSSGALVYDRATPFLPQDSNFTSVGVIKAPDARPQQLGLQAALFPTAVQEAPGLFASAFPALRAPVVSLFAYRGDLGLDNGAPQSVYSLNTAGLHEFAAGSLRPGQTMPLPGGGSVQFAGVVPWADFQVTHDPGRLPALVAAVAMVAGLLLSLRVRRRRLWVRAVPADRLGGGDSVVEAGGLARTDADDFASEFHRLVGRFGGPAPPAADGSGEE